MELATKKWRRHAKKIEKLLLHERTVECTKNANQYYTHTRHVWAINTHNLLLLLFLNYNCERLQVALFPTTLDLLSDTWINVSPLNLTVKGQFLIFSVLLFSFFFSLNVQTLKILIDTRDVDVRTDIYIHTWENGRNEAGTKKKSLPTSRINENPRNFCEKTRGTLRDTDFFWRILILIHFPAKYLLFHFSLCDVLWQIFIQSVFRKSWLQNLLLLR